jgi:hypothetical protein
MNGIPGRYRAATARRYELFCLAINELPLHFIHPITSPIASHLNAAQMQFFADGGPVDLKKVEIDVIRWCLRRDAAFEVVNFSIHGLRSLSYNFGAHCHAASGYPFPQAAETLSN